ncbi:MAG: SPFH domain-containing protein, partial [Candidatus Fimimonas sp.]
KADLYFVNTKQFIDCKWGTTNPVAMRDKDFGIIRIRAHGNYSFRVSDPSAFLREVFGTNGMYKVSDIEGNLRNILLAQITDTIGESKISALDMAMNYQEFAEMVRNNAQAKLDAMGLALTDFNIANINFPESVEKAMDERSSLGILEDQMGTYTQKKAADALSDAAKNPGTGGAFMGIGVGMAAGGALGEALRSANPSNKKETEEKSKFCPECGTRMSVGAKFCPECGKKFDMTGICPHCGKTVDPSAKFCPECGGKIK